MVNAVYNLACVNGELELFRDAVLGLLRSLTIDALRTFEAMKDSDTQLFSGVRAKTTEGLRKRLDRRLAALGKPGLLNS